MVGHEPGRVALGSRRSCTLAVLTAVALTTGCASGGGGDSSGVDAGGRRTETVGLGTTAGFVGLLDLTVDASVAQASVPAPRRRVWSVLPAVFETLGVEVEGFDSTRGIIGNSQFEPTRLDGQRMSRFLDCGNSLGGPNADRYRVLASFMVQIEDAADDGTTVTTVIDAYARPRSVSGNSVHCTSRGTLERRVQELINEHLAGN